MSYNYSILFQNFRRATASYASRCVLSAMAFVLAAPIASMANGLFEDRSWQFETVTERTQKAMILDLIERKKAGMYRNTYNNTYHTDYNIAGDYIDCNLTSQSAGNQGSVAQDAPVASPSIGVGSSTSASSSGNAASGTIDAGGNSSSTGLTYQDGGNGTVNNSSNADGTNAVSNSQSNNGSTQASSANNNSFSSSVSGVSGNGGNASVALNSSQSLTNSQVSSSIDRSKACDFNTISGSVNSPINSAGDGNKGGRK